MRIGAWLVLPLLLSGCLSAGSAGGAEEAEPSSSRSSRRGSGGSSSFGPAVPEVSNQSVTFHFLAPPAGSFDPPNGTQATAVPLRPTCCSGTVDYSIRLLEDGVIDMANATLWVRVKEPTVTWGLGCDYAMRLYVQRAQQATRSMSLYCRSALIAGAPVLMPGVEQVELVSDPYFFQPLEVRKGDQLRIGISTYGVYSDLRPTLELLTGSTEYDSRLVLNGLNATMVRPNST